MLNFLKVFERELAATGSLHKRPWESELRGGKAERESNGVHPWGPPHMPTVAGAWLGPGQGAGMQPFPHPHPGGRIWSGYPAMAHVGSELESGARPWTVQALSDPGLGSERHLLQGVLGNAAAQGPFPALPRTCRESLGHWRPASVTAWGVHRPRHPVPASLLCSGLGVALTVVSGCVS